MYDSKVKVWKESSTSNWQRLALAFSLGETGGKKRIQLLNLIHA